MFTASDLLAVLPALASARPVFHSEADFQHSLAWQIHLADPALKVRLETRPEREIHLDMLVIDPSDGRRLAVELKYPTAGWDGTVGDENYHLKSDDAQDITSYDFIKDITRLEHIVDDGHAQAGVALLLTNDSLFWRPPTHGRITNGDAFRIHEGVRLTGSRAWGPNTGAGTMGTTRISPIELEGEYTAFWRTLFRLDESVPEFRVLAIPVGAPADQRAQLPAEVV